MNIVAVIQARMGSTRLPGKMMMAIEGTPIITWVADQVTRASRIHDVWLATTMAPEDDVLEQWAAAYGMPCVRGSAQDVLDRYYQTAKRAEADVIVRITGDCPLHDPAIIDQVVAAFSPDVDYVSNIDPPTFPDGIDVEVFSRQALEKAWEEARLPSEREHVTPYIRNHPEVFKKKNVANISDQSSYRLTLDTPEDFVLIKNIITELKKNGKESFGLADILAILKTHDSWLAINSVFERNEGYKKSVAEDTL